MTARVTVVVTAGAARTSYVYRAAATCEVGRADGCAIRVGDRHRSVSRRHCRLDIDPPHVRLRDLGSSYGTHVNGRRLDRLTEHPVAPGDEIRIGDVRLRITVEEERGPEGSTRAEAHPDFDGYEVLGELGRGSQGVVRLARHLDTGDLVALKHVPFDGMVGESARFAFRREVESVRALRHPHIVGVRDSGERPDGFFLAYAYCPGGTLEQFAARHGGRVPPGEAVPVVRQVLSALDHAHRAVLRPEGAAGVVRGLVHRDVKPSNILLAEPAGQRRPRVRLADFGLAKAFELAGLSGHTRTGAMGGTIPFTPRTQLLRFKYAGPEVDVWATAACLYWLLTGATPRDFPPDRDPVAVALREPVVPVREREPAVPERLARVLDEALVDTPDIRVRRAEELAAALRDAW
ncbi:protein kinase domain-containing protein [Streptomyces sp. NPDC003362]